VIYRAGGVIDAKWRKHAQTQKQDF